MPTVIIPPTDVSPNTGTGSEVLSTGATLTSPILVTPNIGAATGTSLSLTGSVTASDLILGTSGPSVKSTLSARAPRQGLVFDGTAGATVSGPALGTGDFTVVAWVNPNSVAALQALVSGNTNAFSLDIAAGGLMEVRIAGGAILGTASSALVAGKTQMASVRRSGSTNTFNINGVDLASPFTDTSNFTQVISTVGSFFGGGYPFTGTLSVLIYNRALSASEVVALYEAGAPSGADYPGTAAGTSLSTSAFSGTRWGSSFTTFSGASATGFTAARASGGGDDSVTSDSFTVKKGDVIRCVFDMTNSGDLPYIYLGEATTGAALSGLSVTTAGTAQVFNLTVTTAGSARVAFYTANAQTANYTVANFTARPLGLLLAPDAAQAGGGLVWYDTSGNAANITLPASGVSWNVPSSRYLGGNWTTSGNHVVSGGSIGVGGAVGSYFDILQGGNDAYAYNRRAGQLIFGTNNTTVMQFASNGNCLLKSDGVDGGQKLQVSGTASIRDSVLVSATSDPTNYYFKASANYNYGKAFSLEVRGGGATIGDIFTWADAAGLTLNSLTGSNLTLKTSNATALTLDSSQNATFAGKITANGAGSTFKGTATNDNAAAGYVGEYVSSTVLSASAVSLTNGVAANITSISLTAGDWDVTGLAQYNFTGATCSYVYHGFTTASAAFGAANSYVQDYRNYIIASVSTHSPTLTFRISLAATTTVYFVTQADFSAGTVGAYGVLRARRVR